VPVSATVTPPAERIQLPRLPARSYQRRIFAAFEQGYRRFLFCLARRLSKTRMLLELTVKAAFERPGEYAYVAPTLVMARRIAFEGLDHTGRRMLTEVIPAVLIRSITEADMRVELVNGAVIRFLGADDTNRLRGLNLVGIAIDEYAVMESAEVLMVVLPMLAENRGFLVVGSTPLGQNHFKALYDTALAHPDDWFSMRLTVEDAYRDAPGENGERVVTPAAIEEARRDGMDEATVQQEFMCSFSGPVSGSVYGKEMEQAEREGRVLVVPYNAALRVFSAWDLGVNDSTVIVMFQRAASGALRIIDCLEGQGEGLAFYIRALQERPYVWAEHFGPHDLNVRELGTGKSRLEQARALGIRFKVVASLPVVDGIAAVRALLSRCYFDQTHCRPLLQALAAYRREWSSRLGVYGAPRHDASSHFADAMRYLAIGERDRDESGYPRRPYTAKMAAPPRGGRAAPTRISGVGLTSQWPS
jgi:phage terminase large subunit